jgi:hypothetical protein
MTHFQTVDAIWDFKISYGPNPAAGVAGRFSSRIADYDRPRTFLFIRTVWHASSNGASRRWSSETHVQVLQNVLSSPVSNPVLEIDGIQYNTSPSRTNFLKSLRVTSLKYWILTKYDSSFRFWIHNLFRRLKATTGCNRESRVWREGNINLTHIVQDSNHSAWWKRSRTTGIPEHERNPRAREDDDRSIANGLHDRNRNPSLNWPEQSQIRLLDHGYRFNESHMRKVP